MAGLLAIFAEFEREILRERTRDGLAHAREKRETAGSTRNRGHTRCGNPEVALRRDKPIRNCPAPADRPDVGAPDFGLTYFSGK
jgi:DNA invertase Pin-like site-specific DNA recombinase